MLVQWCPTLVQCGRSGETVKREVARSNTRDVGRLDGGAKDGTEGLRGVGDHGADISSESALHAWAKLRHSNDLNWVQGRRGRRCQRCGH